MRFQFKSSLFAVYQIDRKVKIMCKSEVKLILQLAKCALAIASVFEMGVVCFT